MDQTKLIHLDETIKHSRNVLHLKLMSISPEGLISAEIRKAAWPMILACGDQDWEIEECSSKDAAIIEKDVDRSMFGIDIADDLTEDERLIKRNELSKIINTVIYKNPELNYPQGFNQICTVFLLTAGLETGYKLSEKCANSLLKDTMRPSFEHGLIQQLKLIYKLLDSLDPLVARKLESIFTYQGTVDIPSIAVPWVLCWLSNTFYKYKDIARIFDFCIATHALAPVYLSAVIIMMRRASLLQCDESFEIFGVFKEIDGIDVERLCQDAFKIMLKITPQTLANKYKELFLNDSPVFNDHGFTDIVRRKKSEKLLGRFMLVFLITTSTLIFFKG